MTDIEKLNKQVETLQKKLDERDAAFTNVNKKIQAKLQIFEDLKKELTDLEAERDNLIDEKDNLEQEKKALETERDALKDEKNQLKLERDDLQTKKTEWETKDKASENQIKKISQTVTETDLKADNLLAQIEALDKSLDLFNR